MQAPHAPGKDVGHIDPWAILDALHDPCSLLSTSGALLYANAAARRLHGTSGAVRSGAGADYFTEHGAALGLGGDDLAALKTALDAVLSGAQPHAELEYSYWADEQQRWLTTSIDAYAAAGPSAALIQQHDITARKQAQSTQQLYERALAAASTGIVISDQRAPDQPLIYCNAAFERITGYAQAEAVGHNCRFLQGPDTDPEALAEIRQALTSGSECRVVLKNYRKDGSAFWNELLMAPIRNALQQVTHFVGVQTDITERKDAKEALEVAEERLRFLSEITVEGLAIHEQGQIVDVNQAITTIFGYGRKELLGMSVLDLATPESHDEIIQKMQAGYDRPYETVGVRKDGSTFPIEIQARPTQYRGRTLRVASVRDITERKRVEESMAHTQQFLNSVIENIPLMLIVKDAKELRFVRFNKAGEQLLGYSRDELIGKNDHDFFPAKEADFFTAKDRQVLTGRQVVDIPEEPIQTSHLGQRILHTRKIPILDERGEPEYLLAIAEDITERKQAEAALQLSESRYQKLISNIPGMVYQFALAPDGSSGFTLVSEGSRAILNVTPDALKADAALLFNALCPEDQPGLASSFHESSTLLQPWQWEGRVAQASGSPRWIQGIGRPERQEDGSIVWDGVLFDITERKQAAEALKISELQAETIRVQAAVLEEISTPIFPISANVVLMPLIGSVDSARARQMIEVLLQGVQLNQARTVIVDITGVPVVDTQVANVLIQAAQAVRLLGAQIVITGIRPEIAQTLVSLGIDLRGLTTRGSLQSGVAYALENR